MKHQSKSQRWVASTLIGLALAGSTSLCLAADISYSFSTDAQGWYAADAHGNVVWDATHGRGGGGCLKYTLVAATDTEIDPRVDVEFDTSGAFSVEFDIMVDASSGVDAGGSYGNLQIVARDADWSWDAMWYGAVGAPFNSYQHVKRAFTSAYGLKTYLQLQLQGTAPYSSDVIVYLDNVVIRDGTPPEEASFHDFAWPEAVTAGVSSWVGGTPASDSIAVSHETTLTNGALKFTVNYNASNSGWQEGDVQIAPYDWDPSKFTWIEFDVYLDAPTGLAGYGGLQVFEINSTWGWQNTGWNALSAANIGTWTHYKRPLINMTGSKGIVIQVGGGMQVPFTYYVDNIKLWKPASPPMITAMEKDQGVGGVQVKMGSSGNWERNALVTPTLGTLPTPLTWVGQTPVTYSMTITNFPDATKHPSFEAHIYLVNGDTVANNETTGSADWNAADIVILNVQNNNNSGVNFALAWKTNAPAINPPNTPARIDNLPSALGTWSVTFTNDFSGIISGPGGVSTNFTLPEDIIASNFSPGNMFVQFGAFEGKGDSANDPQFKINDGQGMVFSHVLITNVSGLVIEDSFAGPELTTLNAWRTTSSAAVQWLPPGIGLWLSWTTPDDGYSVEVAGNVTGPYTDAGITVIIANGANKSGAVPAASIPAGNAAFFRMRKPVP